MIKPEELRIGNLILAKGKITTILSIDDRGINRDPSFGEYGSMDYLAEFNNIFHGGEIEPILITNEMLENCGFDSGLKAKVKEMNICLVREEYLIYNIEQSVFTIEDKESSAFYVPYIQPLFLHQLQNLFFVFTGKELNANI